MPTTPNWQLQMPIHAVIFDCDGTLSTIEGIDELAEMNHAGDVVEKLTAEAMGQSGLNPDLYRKRLELVLPTQEQVNNLGEMYFANRVPEASDVIRVLQRLNKSIYLVSAGLFPAVAMFGDLLNIPRQNIMAVDIQFDENGNYLAFDATSPLATNHGKREIITQLKSKYERVAHTGDGINDYVARDLSIRFVGYGGVFYRENIAAGCEFYIKTPSLSALLPLLLTQQESLQLTPEDLDVYNKGLASIHDELVIINSSRGLD